VLNPFFLNNIEERNDISMGQEEWSVNKTEWWVKLEVLGDCSVIELIPIWVSALKFFSYIHWDSGIPLSMNYVFLRLLTFLSFLNQIDIFKVDFNICEDILSGAYSGWVPIEVDFTWFSESNSKLELSFMNDLSVFDYGVKFNISMDDLSVLKEAQITLWDNSTPEI
jgi:hypothetical protein